MDIDQQQVKGEGGLDIEIMGVGEEVAKGAEGGELVIEVLEGEM